MGRSTPGQTGKKRAKHVRGNVTPTARSGERTLNSGDIKSDVGCGADSNSLISSFSEHGSRVSQVSLAQRHGVALKKYYIVQYSVARSTVKYSRGPHQFVLS